MYENGNFVRDLKPDDFEIYEDGVLQEVATFQLVDLPMPVQAFAEPGLPPAESDVVTNEAVAAEGHIYALVLDDLHTRPVRTQRVRELGRQFIERWFGENDMAVVTTTGGASEDSPFFTRNKQLLLKAIDRFSGRQLRSQTLEQIELREEYIMELIQLSTLAANLRSLDQEHAFRARTALSHLEAMSRILGDMEGQKKVLLYIGEGIPYNTEDYFRGESADMVRSDMRRALGTAGLANVSFYTLDARGLSDGQEDVMFVSRASSGTPFIEVFRERQGMGQAAPASRSGTTGGEQAASAGDAAQNRYIEMLMRSLDIESMAFANEARRSHDVLYHLAEETGGVAAVNNNDFEDGLRRIVADNRSFYQLGYTPPNVNPDGRFRKIEVKVKGRPVIVRARKGYIVPEEGERLADVDGADALEADIQRDLLGRYSPITGIPLRVLTFPFRLDEDTSSIAVVVESDIAGFRFTEQDGRFHDKVKVSAIVLDETGTWVDGQTNTFDLALEAPAREKMDGDGFRTVSVLEIPPGSYQLRLGVWEEGGEQRGSIFTDLNIPDPKETELAMSGVLLSSKEEESVLVASATEVRQSIPFVPSTRREFAPSDQVVAGVQIFENPSFPKDKEVLFQTTVLDEQGEKVVESKSTSMFPGQKPLFLRSRIGLSDFSPGLYVIDIQGREPDGRLLTRARNVFRVVGAPSAADLPLSASYIDLLKSYSDGHFDEARKRLATWTSDSLEGLADQLESNVSEPRTLAVAVVLHTELSALNAWGLPVQTRAQHLEVARALAALLPGDMDFKRQWLLTVAAVYHGSNPAVSLDYLKEARQRFPHDADVLLSSAVTYETSAAINRDTGKLGDAEKYCREAIKVDPDLAEAHLRLGSVLQQRGGGGRVKEAERELQWVVDQASDPFLLYLANLFLGDLYGSQDDVVAAIAHYRAAIEAEPRWQAAHIALSHALRAKGDRSEARRVMQRALRLPVNDPRYVDGYRLYALGQLHNVPQMLEELRQGVVK
jgi:VWFA-related protein